MLRSGKKSPQIASCGNSAEYFIADQVWIKFDEFDEIVDMVIVDAKLSFETVLTNGQKAAKNHTGESLAKKVVDIIEEDELRNPLPDKIIQGDLILL